ncbi:MAG: transporter substrate-binding domain-containing protein [Desulfomonilia bacterium]
MKISGLNPCILICILIVLISSRVAMAGQNLVIAVNPTWPPMQMKEKGDIVGYEIDMLNALADEVGVQVCLVEVPWSTIFRGLNKGLYDAVLASVSITRAREARYDFSDSYFTTEQLLVIPKARIQEPLMGKAIGVFKLTTGADAFRSVQKCRVTFYTVEEIEKAFSDLVKGDLSGVLCDSPVAFFYTSFQAPYPGAFTIANEMPDGCTGFPKENYGIVVEKGNTPTLDLINQGLRSIKAKGIDELLRKKWFPTPLDPEQREFGGDIRSSSG